MLSPLKFLILFLILCTHLYGVREFAEGTHTASGISLGNIGTNLQFPIESSFYNPATLTQLDRIGTLAGYGFANEFNAFTGHFFYPASIGVMGISAVYLGRSNGNDLQSFGYLNIGYARKIYKRFYLGFYLRPSYGKSNNKSFFGLGLDPAFYFDSKFRKELYKGIGLYNPGFYAMARNASFYIGNTSNLAPRMSFHLGAQTSLFRTGYYDLGLYTEAQSKNPFSKLPMNLGLQLSYRHFTLKTGYSFSQADLITSGLSLGAGFNHLFQDGNIAINYGVLLSSKSNTGPYHFISVNGSYSYVDEEPPEVSIKTNTAVFSPNNDGTNDYIYFETEVKDYSPILSWQLVIKNTSGKVVRIFENDKRQIEKYYSFTDRFRSFFRNRESLVVPTRIRWDGTLNAIGIDKALTQIGSNNGVVVDGRYFYEFDVIDLRNNKSITRRGQFLVDTQAPQLKVSITEKLFSPNGDGALENLNILLDGNAAPGDVWSIKIKNDENQDINYFQFASNQLPSQFTWNGKDRNQKKAPEGIYSITIEGIDFAGNHVRETINNITLIRTITTASLTLSNQGFSPNSDGILDELIINPKLSSLSHLKLWQILLFDEKPKPNEKLPESVMKWQGAAAPPKQIKWQGFNHAGEKLGDGKYYILIKADYITGNHPQSIPKVVSIDSRAPKLSVEADLNAFSPDGDGKKETQIFYLFIEDMSDIQDYELNVYEIQYLKKSKKKRFLFKTYKGKNSYPEKIYWDGKGDAGNIVDSATIYEYELKARDIYGNAAKSITSRFETDILVVVTERGLKIRLSNVEFTSSSHKLKRSTLPLLETLINLLDNYHLYKIKVEGHTDDRGSEEYNLKLSERRAKTVADYLIAEGIDSGRVTFQGIGEVSPLLPNTSEYNRSKNRRVEFLLFK